MSVFIDKAGFLVKVQGVGAVIAYYGDRSLVMKSGQPNIDIVPSLKFW
jgi:hypothetical protein